INSEVIKNAKVLIVQMEIPIESIEEIFKIAVQGKAVKILNPAPLKPISLSILRKIDVIIPNEGELLRLHSLLNLKELVGESKGKIIQASKDKKLKNPKLEKIYCKVGIDSYGAQMISQLNTEGVDIEHIIRDPYESSGIAFIMIDENGENMISVAPGANFNLTPEDVRINSEVIKNAKVLIVQMEIPIESIEEIFKIAVQGKAVKILNPAPLKPISLSILRKIDVIIPNEGELLRLHSLLNLKELVGESKGKIIQASKDISKLG
ncbi:unnamed protein product, partial [marine sediment metagenome]